MRSCLCRAPIARSNSKKVEIFHQSVGVDACIRPYKTVSTQFVFR